ncbi:MAG: hypothetical protein SFV51_04130 [Bryobacteraceae bacterium]|nr:hypothetical protein [Bryobacteraceae bacterium]
MHTIRIFEKGDAGSLVYEAGEHEYKFSKDRNRQRNVVVKLQREDGNSPLGGIRVFFTDKERDGGTAPPPRGFVEEAAYEGFGLWADSTSQRLTLQKELYLRFPDEKQHLMELHIDRDMRPPQDAEIIIEC